jgi:hypothetical protein
MRICIVIQSDAFRTSAGMRIRYDRFRDHLDPDGTIEALTCAELIAAKRLEHDAYIFCKTFDTSALLLARKVRASGKVVGQDLFDDYFSQYSDTRLARFRDWLRDMAPVTDFVLCSTPRMADVIRAYLPQGRITVIEDPVSEFDKAAVQLAVEGKLKRAQESRQINLVWFGIGDNPFFPVGLRDLAACAPQLASMERLGWDVKLRIVTNRRPFEGAGGEVLRPLSIGFDLVEWTEEAEKEALHWATAALLPVNGQSFSVAKSMNRAITALNAGCQVLSVGYPLYRRLDKLIYRSATELVSDMDAGRLKLRPETIDALNESFQRMADPKVATAAFVGEARRAVEARGRRPEIQGTLCLIHGRNSTIGLHKLVNSIGGLSVKSIFATAGWNFPVRFDRAGSEIVMRVTPQLAHKYALPVKDGSAKTSFGTLEFLDIDAAALGVRSLHVHLGQQANPVLDLPIYEDVIRFAEECCAAAFSQADVLISDTSPFIRLPQRVSASTKVPARKRRGAAAAPTKGRPQLVRGAKPRSRNQPWSPVQKLASFVRGSQALELDRAVALIETSSLFDPDWYLMSYPDVAASGADPARHYLQFGWRENRNPSPEFSTKGYLKAHKDVAAQGFNPLVHYLEYGQLENRKVPPADKGSVSR